MPYLAALLTSRLNGPAEYFVVAAGRLAARVRTEGDRGVLAYRFFVDEARATARAVVDYRDPAAWIGHHEIIAGWDEMAALRGAATLTEITLLGAVSDAMLAWLESSGLTAEVRHGARFAAGFVRSGADRP